MTSLLRLAAVGCLALAYATTTGCVRHAPAAAEAPAAEAPKHEDTCPFCKAKKAAGHDHAHCEDPDCPCHHDHEHARVHEGAHDHAHEGEHEHDAAHVAEQPGHDHE